MIYSDYHVHSNYSIDSNEPMLESIRCAIDKNFKEIVFTDHYETIDPKVHLEDIIDYSEYRVQIRRLKKRFSDVIDIKLGTEINMELPLKEELNQLLNQHNFDFIIGSVHAVNFVDVGTSQYYNNLDVHGYHEKYLNDLFKAVQGGFNYSVLGHLDFVSRYGPYENNKIDLNRHQEMVDEILLKIIENGKGIGLNTSGRRYGINDFHPSTIILKRYKELGGEIITIGSDAHQSKNIGMDFELAEGLLIQVGYKYYTTFDKLRPKFNKLGGK